MTALDPLPDDWRPATWGLELLTGVAKISEWHWWGFIDGWNWVAERRPICSNIRLDHDYREICYPCREKGLTSRNPAEHLFEGDEFAYMEGYGDGVRKATEEACSPVSHIGESLGTEPPSLNVVSEEEDPESMTG